MRKKVGRCLFLGVKKKLILNSMFGTRFFIMLVVLLVLQIIDNAEFQTESNEIKNYK